MKRIFLLLNFIITSLLNSYGQNNDEQTDKIKVILPINKS